ncbi:MAG: ATP-binding protein [Verrucomicrobiota bacterium]
MKQKLQFESDSGNLVKVRQAARLFLAGCGFEECQAELLVLAVDEACTNIIRHAYSEESKPVRLEMEKLRDRVRFTLRDYGRSCAIERIHSRELEDVRPGGVGVHIIRQAFDSVNYKPCARGTKLILEKKLAGNPPVFSADS